MSSIQHDANIPQEGIGQKLASNNGIHIASEDRDVCQDAQTSDRQVNKYKYAEFSGFAGERYLKEIIQAICPVALFRTWCILVERQAPGNDAYSGVRRVAHVAARSERKIYQDLEEFKARGLLSLEAASKTVQLANGAFRVEVVTVKNFEQLYDLAHEYHEWTRYDEAYIPPLREYAATIISDPTVFQKLIRFECYRKILLLKKPGPKAQPRQNWYNQSVEDLLTTAQSVIEYNAKDAQTNNSDDKEPILKKQLEKQLEKHSLYRNNTTENIDREKGSNSSTSQKGMERPGAIGKSKEETIHHTETSQERRDGTDQRNRSNSKPNLLPPTAMGAGADRAETIQGYSEYELKQDKQKRAAAAVGIPPEHNRKLNGGQDNAEREQQRQWQAQAQEGRADQPTRYELPVAVEEEVREFATRYDDKHLIQSDVTRITKLYNMLAQVLQYFNQDSFLTIWRKASETAYRMRGCEHVNLRGRRNVMPYLFVCLESAFGVSLEEQVYLRSPHALYEDSYSVFEIVDMLRAKYEEETQTGQTTLAYRAWLENTLDWQEKRKEPKDRRKIPTVRR